MLNLYLSGKDFHMSMYVFCKFKPSGNSDVTNFSHLYIHMLKISKKVCQIKKALTVTKKNCQMTVKSSHILEEDGYVFH